LADCPEGETVMKALRDVAYLPDEPVKLSICSITYNHAGFIRECMEGFLDQRCDFRVEIIIHDDASTDGTTDILRDYASRYPEIITLITQEHNQFSKGVNPYYAHVFPRARGKFIAICDGDDYWADPNKLMSQTAVMEGDESIVLTYGRTHSLNDGKLDTDFHNGSEKDLSAEELKCCGGINTLTTCFRNVFAGETPKWMVYSPIGDLTVWAILSYHGRGVFLPDLPPAVYRLHQGGILSQQSTSRQLLMTMMAVQCMNLYHYERNDMAGCRRCIRQSFVILARLLGLRDIFKNLFYALKKRRWFRPNRLGKI
jgi:glycosyltransferase involved in cell wall biosynthesis